MRHFIAFITTILFFTTSLSGQINTSGRENSLLVKGIAILKQTPELLTARITVKASADKFSPCQDKLVRAIDQAKAILVKRGIEKGIIHTNDLNVSEKRDYLAEGRYKISYEGNSDITIEHEYSQEYSKKLLSALQSDSANFVYHLDFVLSENQKKILRQEAIASAIADAREKALAIALSANLKLSRIKNITYTDDFSSGYESDLVQENIVGFRGVAMMSKESAAPVIDFNPKEIGIKKSVTIEWWIEEKK
ncbi:MAG: SIMPL domain-containing protein [Prolixibacteraceae bacterium]